MIKAVIGICACVVLTTVFSCRQSSVDPIIPPNDSTTTKAPSDSILLNNGFVLDGIGAGCIFTQDTIAFNYPGEVRADLSDDKKYVSILFNGLVSLGQDSGYIIVNMNVPAVNGNYPWQNKPIDPDHHDTSDANVIISFLSNNEQFISTIGSSQVINYTIASDTISGSFSGTLIPYSYNSPPNDVLTISNGKFHAPIR